VSVRRSNMTPETINQIKEALAPIAEKIGVGAEYGWEILVAGQFAEGVAMLIICGILLSIVVALVFTVRTALKNEWDEDVKGFLILVGGIIVLLILMKALGEFSGAIIKITAPEYAALKFLISLGG